MKKTLLFFFTFLSISCFAQLSNKHWIPPLHSRNPSNEQIADHYVYLSTAETTPFLVTVTDGSGIPFTGSPFLLSASNSVEIKIGDNQPSKMFLELIDVNKVVSDKGIILEGSHDFYVSFRMMAQNHSETLISKGRPGIGTSFRLGCTINESTDNRKNFVASVMATEDNTDITLSDYDPGVIFASGNGDITSDTQFFPNLKAGESIVFSGYSNTTANLTGIIGALITSNNPIAVNTGNALGGIENKKADITLDQIVPVSKVGEKYIFIEGNGSPLMETPLIVGTVDGTTIKINGISISGAVINAGGPNGYYQIPNSYYIGTSHKNMYVETSQPVYAYQLLGGGTNTATSGLNFIPPLSCFFQKSVNIPKVNEIGDTTYISDLMILTSNGASLTVNGSPIPITQAQSVQGNMDWSTYRISNVTGDAHVVSTGPLAVGVFGFEGTASGYAGYYSGFGSTPEDTNVTVCSNTTQNLFDIINGNPDTGGTWVVPIGGQPLDGNIFDPKINISGDYFYSFPNCDPLLPPITIKINVTVQQSKNAGTNNSIIICADSSSFDLFSLLGTADAGGTWSPALASGTGVFNPAIDLSGNYTYGFPFINACAAISASINVTNNILPIIIPITNYEKCDDNLDGNDANGFIDFDLTTKNSEILGVQMGINITYHIVQSDAQSGINPITALYSNNRIIYARLTNIITGCHLVASFKVVVLPLPNVTGITIIQCDDNLDAITSFNLAIKNDVISSNFANETFTYYTSFIGATTSNPAELITNPLAFVNTTPSLMFVWARVANSNGCFRVAKLTLQVLATNIPSTYNIQIPPVCDDLLDISGNSNLNNNKRDGIATFNFSATRATIQLLLPSTGVYNINYYRNQADALAETNVITDISNYRNIGYPNTQNIWVRVDSAVDNACFGLGPFVTLTVEKLPFANVVSIPRKCDDDQDGIFTFNTSNLETTLKGTNQTFAVTVTYFDAANSPLKDANGVLITSPFPATFITSSQTIKAVVTNNTTLKCYDETSIQFIVDDKPEAFAIPAIDLTECDDEKDPADQNGLFDFNTSLLESAILQGQNGMQVTYTLENGTVLATLGSTFTTGTQNVLVTVTNPLNPSCPATTTLNFKVNPLPNINLNTDGDEDELVCSNDPTFYVQLNAGIQDGSSTNNYTYVWSKDGTVLIDQTHYTLDVNSEGIYTVEVKNNYGCGRIRKIKVTPSDIAHIQSIVIVDLTDINTVTVKVTGTGDYEYSIDEPSGPFQDSNFFNNVPAGIHNVYINDKNGCGTVSQPIAVIGVPKYFTPNNDGYNDYWTVKGVNANFNGNSIIYIFDRYGKLLKQVVPSNEGWDGTFNGTTLPADDYWYTIKLEDGREAKGHFSLKR